MIRKVIYILIFVCFFCVAKAQNLDNFGITFSGGYGWVAPINDFVKGINPDNTKINSIANFDIRLTKEVDGSKDWHYLYNGFYYGAGVFHGRFNYSKQIGNPFALYGLVGFNVWHTKSFSLKVEMALGFSGIWQVYDNEHRYNVAVSTPIESYIHGDVEGYFSLNPHWQINLGAKFIHFSNGNMRQPNKGINILTPSLGFTYIPKQLQHLDRKTARKVLEDKDAFRPYWQSQYNIYFAQKRVYVFYQQPDKNNIMQEDTARGVYPIFGLQARFLRKFAINHAFGIGTDLSYNNSIGKNKKTYYYPNNYKDDLSSYQHLTFSAFASYEYNIHRLSIMLEPGVYIYRYKDSYLPQVFERINLRYQFNRGIFLQLGIRAYDFRKADYIEWGIGYQIKHRK
ncbi:MAG: acyloxyacyl hydrolase [Bacteroidota bacterium]|nr:acyloxyacyl hydrolase [Bacteroidota bacterium]